VATVDSTSFDAALKEYYTDEHVRDTVYDENPLFSMLPKMTSLTGDVYVQPVQYGLPMSRSADIAKALANKKTNLYKKFQITTADDYAAISIARKVMKQSSGNRGAFFEARTREIDGMLKSLVRSISNALYRNGGGSIGRVSTGTAPSGTTLTLNDAEDVSGFEVGQVLVASANDGSVSTDTLRVGSVEITAVDRDAGTLTGSVAWTTGISGLTTSDYLFVDGDFGVKLVGLGGWLGLRNDAATAPGSTAFFGVDRSSDVTRLAGIRVSAAGDPIAEALRKGCSRLGREGKSPDCAFISHQKYRDLVIELGNKVEYTTTNVTANVGFTGVKIVGARRPVTVYPDHNCPDKFAYLIDKGTWKIISHGPIPDLHDDDGVRMLRDATADSFEVRASYYANTACADPSSNGLITLE